MERLTKVLKWAAPALVRWRDLLLWIAKWSPYKSIFNRDGTIYMQRCWLIYPRWFTGGWGARVHIIHTSDDDRALHDHPWDFASVILKRGYYEIVRECRDEAKAESWAKLLAYVEDAGIKYFAKFDAGRWCVAREVKEGEVNAREMDESHRLRLKPAIYGGGGEYPAMTLFFHGPIEQRWGFMVDRKKVLSKQYIAQRRVSP